jgi:hypothetical protein
LQELQDILTTDTLEAALDGSITAKELLERLLLFKELGYTWDSYIKENLFDEINLKPIFDKIALRSIDKECNCNLCSHTGHISTFERLNEELQEVELICPKCNSLAVQII